jgi:glutamate-1-semialdehyde 2,1-aminomutase
MTYDLSRSYEMFERAEKVVPSGIYGTRSPRFATFGDFPVFVYSAEGGRFTDVDGNEYIDLMCAYGPNILGYRHPAVQAAVLEQESRANSVSIPTDRTLELAEALVRRFSFGDWVMFGKNGSDVTTLATRIARHHTGRPKLLVATGAYHGFHPWSVPDTLGIPPSYRAEIDQFRWNDTESVHEAFARNEGDVAAVMICPMKHDAMHDMEMAAPGFLAAIQEHCRDSGALLIIDDIRCGFRLNPRIASHLGQGLEPDLVCFGKGIANGQPLSVIVGRDAHRDAAKALYFSATFFFSGVPMAAALATLAAYDEEGAYERMASAGHALRQGMLKAAARANVRIRYTGPDTMPNMLFEDDPKIRIGRRFSGLAARRGVIFHPRHNWFLSAAHTPEDISRAVEVAEECFRIVAEEIELGAFKDGPQANSP